jgi:hypothetical protein
MSSEKDDFKIEKEEIIERVSNQSTNFRFSGVTGIFGLPQPRLILENGIGNRWIVVRTCSSVSIL